MTCTISTVHSWKQQILVNFFRNLQLWGRGALGGCQPSYYIETLKNHEFIDTIFGSRNIYGIAQSGWNSTYTSGIFQMKYLPIEKKFWPDWSLASFASWRRYPSLCSIQRTPSHWYGRRRGFSAGCWTSTVTDTAGPAACSSRTARYRSAMCCLPLNWRHE